MIPFLRFIMMALPFILLSFVMMIPIKAVWAATYYVDATVGRDSNNGLSTGLPWKTIAKVNKSSFSAGDSILFKKGEVWREELIVRSSGSAGNPIIFGSFGIGAKPIIKASDLVTGFTAEAVGGFTAYKKAFGGTTPKQVFENSIRIMQVAAKSSLVAGSWFWDAANTQIYVRTSGDTNPSGYTIEASARRTVINVEAVSDVTIQDLDLAQAKAYNISGAKSNLTIQRCTVHDAFINNIALSSRMAFVSPAVYDNDVYGAGGTGISITYNFTGLRIQRNNVHENSRLHHTQAGGSTEQRYSSGIKLFTDGVAESGADTLISNNTVWGNGPHSWVTPNGNEEWRGVGIWLDTVKIPTGIPALVRYNTVRDNAGAGVYLEKTQRCGAEYNLIYNNATYSFTANLWLGTNSARTATNSWAFNNTIYGTGWAAVMMGNDSAPSAFTGHSLKNNIIWATTTARHIYFQGTGGDTGSGNVLDYNLYGTGATFIISTAAATLKTDYSTLAAWKAASGQDAHSINADPLFVNAAIANFILQSGSPAINKGTIVGLSVDFAGRPVPTGSAPDLGAYESQPSLPPAPRNLRILLVPN